MEIRHIVIKLNDNDIFTIDMQHPNVEIDRLIVKSFPYRNNIKFKNPIGEFVTAESVDTYSLHPYTLIINNTLGIDICKNANVYTGNIVITLLDKYLDEYKNYIFIELINGEYINIKDFLSLIPMSYKFNKLAGGEKSALICNNKTWGIAIRKREFKYQPSYHRIAILNGETSILK